MDFKMNTRELKRKNYVYIVYDMKMVNKSSAIEEYLLLRKIPTSNRRR